MKYSMSIFMLCLILLTIPFSSCQNSTSPDSFTIYYNSFEKSSDLMGWNGIEESDLVDDAAPNGGQKSAFISGGCNMPTAFRTFSPIGVDQSVRIQCYGKNLGFGGSVVIGIGENYSYDLGLSVKDTTWTFYEFDNSIFWPANSSLTICLNSGGILATAMLIDELKIVKSN